MDALLGCGTSWGQDDTSDAAALAEEMATLNEDAAQLDAELLEVQREMLETIKAQLAMEREKNRILVGRLDEALERLQQATNQKTPPASDSPRFSASPGVPRFDPSPSLASGRSRLTTSELETPAKGLFFQENEAVRDGHVSVLRAVFREYADEAGVLSRRNWGKLCEDAGFSQATSTRDVDLAFLESRKRTLDFDRFVQVFESLLSRRRTSLDAYMASPRSALLRARAAVLLLDQPCAVLAKCGPHMVAAASATVAAALAAECELLAQPSVLRLLDAEFPFLDRLFKEARVKSVQTCAALLADVAVVPALLSRSAATRLASALVARDAAIDDDDFRSTKLPSLLLGGEDENYDFPFLLFVELLGHIALRAVQGRAPADRLKALFERIKRRRDMTMLYQRRRST